MSTKTENPSIKSKLRQLDELVAWFEGDEFELEKAAGVLKQAQQLTAEIEAQLETVANDVRVIKESLSTDSL